MSREVITLTPIKNLRAFLNRPVISREKLQGLFDYFEGNCFSLERRIIVRLVSNLLHVKDNYDTALSGLEQVLEIDPSDYGSLEAAYDEIKLRARDAYDRLDHRQRY